MIDAAGCDCTMPSMTTDMDALFTIETGAAASPTVRSRTRDGVDALPAGFTYLPAWMPAAEAQRLFAALWAGINWEQTTSRAGGKPTPTPRLTAWFGNSVYRYSGTTNHPQAWLPALADLRDRLEMETGARYNSLLANRYDSGKVHRLGWHSDNEPGLGQQPTIASLSLGASRDFRLRRKSDHDDTYTLKLGAGDLLVMHGESQADWDHCVPVRANVGPRVNLTFRWFN